MFFDVECEYDLQYCDITTCVQIGISKIFTQGSPKIHIASAHKQGKCSYHIVIDISCDIKSNAFIAK